MFVPDQTPAETTESILFERAAGMLKAAGEPARLWLLERLSRGECCVSELAQASGDQLSTVSARLRVLLVRQLVRRRRVGKQVFYSLADDHVVRLVRDALDHAGGHGLQPGEPTPP